MHGRIIYSQGNPCLDGYFSIEKQHLIFGARRLAPPELIIGAMAFNFSPPPTNKVLGDALLAQLKLTKKIITPYSANHDKIKSATYDPINLSGTDSYEEFIAKYRPFTLWTKDDGKTPYLMGVPASERFPLYKKSRSIKKTVSNEILGSEFRKFLTDFVI